MQLIFDFLLLVFHEINIYFHTDPYYKFIFDSFRKKNINNNIIDFNKVLKDPKQKIAKYIY